LGYSRLVGTRLFLHDGPFAPWLPTILNEVHRHGQTIFILDQYGYSEVPFSLLANIFKRLNKPEVILTFAYEHLEGFVQQYDRLSRALQKVGVGPINQADYELAMQVPGGREFFIQRTLHKAFLTVASYFTPFFITSRQSNLAFWLVHLSTHARARDVMTELHWSLHNHFSHYGGSGTHMLGFDPAHREDHRQPFLFDDSARTRTLGSLREQLPSLIRAVGEIDFGAFYAQWANDAPATSNLFAQAIAELATDKELSIKTKAGGAKRNLKAIQPTDIISIPRQLILPMKPAKKR
ncbi:MAG TPA: three-Cys-motif partner protein TcmP, partial [Candidatus Sulfotelmatobacter sp.]|nr:three-Cys-motif partner protein TcmP [Candidatus Sulfotelmatobacter sp.]